MKYLFWIYFVLIIWPIRSKCQSELKLDGYLNYSLLGNLEFDLVQRDLIQDNFDLGLHVSWGPSMLIPPSAPIPLQAGREIFYILGNESSGHGIPFEVGIIYKSRFPSYVNVNFNLTYSLLMPGNNPLHKRFPSIRFGIIPVFGKKRFRYGAKVSLGYVMDSAFNANLNDKKLWLGFTPLFLSYKLNNS